MRATFVSAVSVLLGALFSTQQALTVTVADPTQLPGANRQLPNWEAYETLGVRTKPANFRYSDPATGFPVTKITSSTVPGADNTDAVHDYAEGGPYISREWGNGQHSILIRAVIGGSATTWIADYQRGVGASGWRQFPGGLPGYPYRDTSLSFSNVSSTARILFYVDNGKLIRFNTATMQIEQGSETYDALYMPGGVKDIPEAAGGYMYWLQSSKDDEWFVFQFCLGSVDCPLPKVFAFNRLTGDLFSRTFPGSNEPHLDRDGKYVLVEDGGGGECGVGGPFEYYWHLWDLDAPLALPSCKGPIYAGHMAWARGYFSSMEGGISSSPNFYYDPGANGGNGSMVTTTTYSDPFGIHPSHRAGQWIQDVADITQWYWGSNYSDGEAGISENLFCPGHPGWSTYSGETYMTPICWTPTYQKPFIGIRAVYQSAQGDSNRLSRNLTPFGSKDNMPQGTFFHDLGPNPDPLYPDDDVLYVRAFDGVNPAGQVYFFAPTPVHRGVGLQRLNGTDTRLLCHNYAFNGIYDPGSGHWVDDYYDIPFATTSPDGRVVMFTSNMGQRDGRRDVFIAEMPLSTSADSETISTGTICGGSFTSTQASDDVRECLREGLVNGKAKLLHTWVFSNVPRGTQYLKFEGSRPDVPPDFPTNDNFQFYYNTTGQQIAIVIDGALFDVDDEVSMTVPLNLVTTAPATIYLKIGDVNQNQSSDTQQDRVFIDHLRIETRP